MEVGPQTHGQAFFIDSLSSNLKVDYLMAFAGKHSEEISSDVTFSTVLSELLFSKQKRTNLVLGSECRFEPDVDLVNREYGKSSRVLACPSF